MRVIKDVYDAKHQEYRDEMRVLEIELSEHAKADYDYQTTVAAVLSIAGRVKTIFENCSESSEKRAFLNYILQNPTVDEKKLYFSIAFLFNLVLELANDYSDPQVGRVQNSGLDANTARGVLEFLIKNIGVSFYTT